MASDPSGRRPPTKVVSPGIPDALSPAGAVSSAAEVAAFLALAGTVRPQATGTARGRLIFALDATASRRPTWDRAQHLQAEMFQAAASVGGLDMQLVFYRGFGECKASPWISQSAELLRRMTGVECLGGHTQIAKVLGHARREAEKGRVNALVFIGDAMEENPDDVCAKAGELGLLGVPVFVFQEGGDATAAITFREIARLTKGAWFPFDAASAGQLRDLLRAVAVYAAGGRPALKALGGDGGEAVRLLTRQIG